MGRLTVPEWQSVETSGSLAGDVMAALSRAKRAASGLDVLPLVVAGDAVVIDRATFIDWFGGVEVSNTIKGMAKEMGMKLGDTEDTDFQGLTDLLNLLVECAHAGDSKAFKRAFEKLKQAVEGTPMQSTGTFQNVGPNKLANIQKSLGAAAIVLDATGWAVEKAHDRQSFIEGGVRHDVLVSQTLAATVDDLLDAGVNSQEALQAVFKSTNLDPVDVEGANSRAVTNRSRQYWGWRWDDKK